MYDPNYVQVLREKEQIDLHYRELSLSHLLLPGNAHRCYASQSSINSWLRRHGIGLMVRRPIEYVIVLPVYWMWCSRRGLQAFPIK